MSASPPNGPDPSDSDAISDELDEMEERVVGRRVDPPPSGDLGDDEDGTEPTG